MKKLSTENFLHDLQTLSADYPQKSFLLGVSGGVDSMVLLQLCIQLNIHIEVAHINYHLRAENSDADQALVTQICTQNHIPIHVCHADFKKSKNKNIQTWAREIRYVFFYKIIKQRKIDHIMTAHHLNDQLETFFIHLMRGTGIRGLCGIPNAENKIIRPLLNFSKKDIYDFAGQNAIPFREDESNAKNIYQRNFLRNEIIPQLEKIQPDFLHNFHTTLSHLKAAEQSLNQLIDEQLKKISLYKNEKVFIDKSKLAQLSPFIQYEIMRKFQMKDAKEIQKLFTAASGAKFNTANYIILVHGQEIIIQNKKYSSRSEPIIIEKKQENQYHLSDFNLFTKKFNQEWTYDAEKITFPLILRPKKKGDKFQPKGMKGKKLVSKYLKDEKINQFDRENCRILCDSSGEILGVIPYRQDGRHTPIPNENTYIISILF